MQGQVLTVPNKNKPLGAKSTIPGSRVFSFHCAFQTDMPEDCEEEFYLSEYLSKSFLTLEDDQEDAEYPAGDGVHPPMRRFA